MHDTSPHIVALAGGVGGARMAAGLTQVWPGERLTVAVNIGDDFDHLGLRICPDLDTVVYTLAGVGDAARGWGLAGETYAAFEAMKRLGGPDWFLLGDKDLATHILRTDALRRGQSLTDFTAAMAASLGVGARILPVSDAPVATLLHTDEGLLAFQDYFVGRQAAPKVRSVVFEGAQNAQPSPQLLRALASGALQGVVICPSNPFVSVAPILAIPGVRAAIENSRGPKIAISPIIGGQAIKGPAAKMMDELGLERSAVGVAEYYRGLVDIFVLHETDADLCSRVSALGMKPLVADTILSSDAARAALARTIEAAL